jgi:hypothetical protein
MRRYMANPKAFTIKKWMAQLLPHQYPKHDNTVERLSVALVTDRDLSDFGALITELYEAGYRRAVTDYKAEFEKLGITVNVVPGKV